MRLLDIYALTVYFFSILRNTVNSLSIGYFFTILLLIRMSAFGFCEKMKKKIITVYSLTVYFFWFSKLPSIHLADMFFFIFDHLTVNYIYSFLILRENEEKNYKYLPFIYLPSNIFLILKTISARYSFSIYY